MQRRLSVAISLVGDPKIIFLDEPSTVIYMIFKRLKFYLKFTFENTQGVISGFR